MKKIFEPTTFFSSRGGLHDAVISKSRLNIDKDEFYIEIDDLNSNFEGLPEYSGREGASIKFTGVSNFSFEDCVIENFSGNIYKIECIDFNNEEEEGFNVRINMWPSGFIYFGCGSIEVGNV